MQLVRPWKEHQIRLQHDDQAAHRCVLLLLAAVIILDH